MSTVLPRAWIGADPGMSGALACMIMESEAPLHGLSVHDMPFVEVSGKKRMDFWQLAQILGLWVSMFDVQGATVEDVHAMPKQGVTSSFNFGFSAGALQQAFASAGIRVTLIRPATWKAIYGLKGGRENKGLSRDKATKLFPKFTALWTRVKDDGRAEAALLAHYGSKLRNA